ncbi:MAG: NAD(P)-binding protein [Propionibacterium sp.]|nr:NAD(P)-binding protein [Propionibacterium sp.]
MNRIAVVGAGVAGLALAAGLDPARSAVTLHEQRDDEPVLGSAFAI